MPRDDVPPDDVLDRRGRRRRLIVAALVGFAAGYATLHGTFAMVRHGVSMKGDISLLLAFPPLGAGVGAYLTYWWLARRARTRWFRAQVPPARARVTRSRTP